MIKYLVLSFFLILVFPLSVLASDISITEIMYDAEGSDSGREWIEIYNDSGADIDLSKYKLLEGNSSHNIVPIDGAGILENKSFAIITEKPETFSLKYSSVFKKSIYDASFSLTNSTGEYLGLKDQDGNILFEITYNTDIGANGDGKSLQYFSNKWVTGIPTPMKFYDSVDQSGDIINKTTEKNTQATNTVTNSSNSRTPVYKKEPVMNFVFDTPKNVIVGIKNDFRVTFYGYNGEMITNGKFVWNFGDGETVEQSSLSPVSHAYAYPGTYTVTCIYKYMWYDQTIAIGKTVVSVYDSPFKLDVFYSAPYPALGIINTKDNEYNMFGYMINSNLGKFKIPENTYVGGKDEIVLKLPIGVYDPNTIELLDPYNNVIGNLYPKKEKTALIKITNDQKNIPIIKISEELPFTVQAPSFIQKDALPDNRIIKIQNEDTNKINWVSYIILIFVTLIAGASIVLLKKNNTKEVSQSDEYALQDE